MKKILVLLLANILFSCQQEVVEKKGPIEGVWKRQGSIIYINGSPKDTIAWDGVHIKSYHKNSFNIIFNPIEIDSITGEDIQKGVGIGGYKYTTDNGILTEYVSYGTGWAEDLIKINSDSIQKAWVVQFKLDYGPNHFSQLWPLDSLGNGTAEYYKRID